MNVVVQRCDLVTHAVGDIGASRCPRVCPHDDSAVIRHCHDGSLFAMEKEVWDEHSQYIRAS